MICVTCGVKYDVDDAKADFGSSYNWDLDYTTEISHGSSERHLCGDCAISWMENKIQSQEGFEEVNQDGERDNAADHCDECHDLPWVHYCPECHRADD